MNFQQSLGAFKIHLRLLRLKYGAKRLIHNALVEYEAFRRRARSMAEARERLQFIRGGFFSREKLEAMSTDELRDVLQPLMYLEASLEAQAGLVDKLFRLLCWKVNSDERSEEAKRLIEWRTTLIDQRNIILNCTAAIQMLIDSRSRITRDPHDSHVS